jgi:hypothetical protein
MNARSSKVSIYSTINDVVEHALRKGIVQSADIAQLYTPHARGFKNSGIVVPAEEFVRCSTAALSYAEALTQKHWGVSKCLEWMHKASRKMPLTSIWTLDQIRAMDVVLGNTGGIFHWEIPAISRSDGARVMVKSMTIIEYKTHYNCDSFVDVFAHIIMMAIFGFPVISQFVHILRLEKVIELYARARLFQGWGENVYPGYGQSSVFVNESQRSPVNMNALATTTKVNELENMLHRTTVLGFDEVVMFALARSKIQNLLGSHNTQEYLQYVRRCQDAGISPVGFKYYQEIVHPIHSAPNHQSFVNYSF